MFLSSSTFLDLAAERNLLQASVFPFLADLSATLGLAAFEAADLRWGISSVRRPTHASES